MGFWNDLTNFFKKKDPVVFPSKIGTDVASCVAVLDLSGSAFCLDNHNILFNDTQGSMKVLKPVEEFYSTDDSKNLTARELDDGFTVKWEDKEYFYLARFKVIELAGRSIFQILRIQQPVYGTTQHEGKLVTDERPAGG